MSYEEMFPIADYNIQLAFMLQGLCSSGYEHVKTENGIVVVKHTTTGQEYDFTVPQPRV